MATEFNGATNISSEEAAKMMAEQNQQQAVTQAAEPPKDTSGQEPQQVETTPTGEKGGQPDPFWKEMGFDNQDSVKQALAEYRSLREQPRKSLSPELEELSRFAGDENFYQKAKEFIELKTLNLDSMDELTLIKTHLKYNEEFDEDEINAFMRTRLKEPKKPEDWDDLDDEEQEEWKDKHAAYKLELKRQFRDAQKGMQELKSKISSPSQQNPSIPQVPDTFTFETPETSVEFNLSAEQVQEVQQAAAQYSLQPDQIQDFVGAKYYKQILTAATAKIKGAEAEKLHQDLSNPSPGGRQAQTTKPDPNKQVADQIPRFW